MRRCPFVFAIAMLLPSVLALSSDFPDHAPEKKTGSIIGSVYNAREKKPLADANVIVSGTFWGASTNAGGSFTLRLPAGRYTLEVRCIGYATAQKNIEVITDSVTCLEIMLEPTWLDFPPVVVTGTRSEKTPHSSPIATRVVAMPEIRNQGATDLRDVLAEQPGLNIVQDFSGSGVQVQGFDPDYTLILIDGSPVIGRVAGTLELSRFAVGNIERVEIVKGPTSSLYGSEALAGVINLITREPRPPFGVTLTGKYGELSSSDASANLEVRNGRFGGSFFYNRKSRAHYDLNPQTISWTAPDFTDHTVSSKWLWTFSERTNLTLNGRLFLQDQTGLTGLQVDSTIVRSDDRSDLIDWNLSPALEWRASPRTKLTGKIYFSRYTVDTRLAAQDGSRIFDVTHFDQTYRQAEAQMDVIFSSKHLLKIGSGGIFESVEADRIAQGRRRTQNYLAFLQHEWLPHRALDIIAGARIDAHSDYDPHFSPKLAALWRAHKGCQLRAGFCSGFKAPSFSQLYLDFTNPQVGYSVFGSTGVRESLQALIARGEIRELFIDPATLKQLEAESATALNFSIDAQPFEFLHLRANLFRNDVRDLIDTQPIARKTNNQSGFTYFNLNRVYTQGLELETRLAWGQTVELALGYQYVVAKDKEVVNRLERGEITKTGSSGRVRPVLPEEYGGLFNRSRNSGTARLKLKMANGLTANLRTIMRGKYGLFDLNGNGILDDASEYASPYALVNLHVSYPLTKNVEIAAGAENLTDYIDDQSLAGAPGRLLYARLNFDWQKSTPLFK